MRKFHYLFMCVLLAGSLKGQDLTSRFSLFSDEVVGGSYYSVEAAVINNGSKPAQGYVVGYYVSKDSKFSANDILIYKTGPINTPANSDIYYAYKESGSVMIPREVPVGNYYLFMKADITDTVKETNESNNIYFRKVKVLPQRLDLSITALRPKWTFVYPGSTLPVATGELSQGNTNVANHTINYYLSNDVIYDQNDKLLGVCNVNGNYIGTISNIQQVTIPSGTALGNYYIIAIADGKNQVKETNEKNNTRAAQITVGTFLPDIALKSVSYYVSKFDSTYAGDFIPLRSVVKNTGNAKITNPVVTFYFSKDTLLTPDDQVLSTVKIDSLNPSDTSLFSPSVKVPLTATAGKNYIISRISAGTPQDVVPSNNSGYTSVYIARNFEDVALSPLILRGKVVSPGSEVNTFTTLRSYGTSPFKVKVAYYLSKDGIIDPSDIILDTSSYNVYKNSISYLYNRLFLDSTLLQGTYQLIVAADYINELTESNEVNNIISAQIIITEKNTDLSVKLNEPFDQVFYYNFPVEITLTDYNTGTTFADDHHIYFALSKDTIFDISDNVVNIISARGLEGGETESYAPYFSLHTDVAPGDYYLVVKSYHPTIRETDKSNNTDFVKITLMPLNTDYSVKASRYFSNPVIPTSSVAIKTVVSNTGTVHGGYPKISFYLSKDTIPDLSEKLNSHSIYMWPESTQTLTYEPYLNGAPLGDYYMIVKIDSENEVEEADETNNISFFPLTVVPAVAKLRIETDQNEIELYPGDEFYLSATIFNDGTIASFNTTGGIFVSKDSVIDSGDLLVNTFSIPGVANGYDRYVNTTFTMPSDITSGPYYMILKTDYQNEISEVYQNNVIAYKRISILPAKTSQRVALKESTGNSVSFTPYPNPTTGIINFNISGGTDELEITDATGAAIKILKTGELAAGQLDLGTLGAGVYTLKLKNEGNLVSMHKVIVTR